MNIRHIKLLENGMRKFCKRCGKKYLSYSRKNRLCNECYYKAIKKRTYDGNKRK